MTSIVWFRGHDLRLIDNEALCAAAARGPVVPVYVHAPEEEGEWPLGGAARWWLHHSLSSLDEDLQRLGGRLIVCSGATVPTLLALAQAVGATAVYAQRRTEPAAAQIEVDVASNLGQAGIEMHLSQQHTLVTLGSLRTGQGGPYRVFTPFWKAMRAQGEPPDPIAPPSSLRLHDVTSERIEDLGLLDTVDWAAGLRQAWSPGEAGAAQQLLRFCQRAGDYDEHRDRPDMDGTSSLSPHLRFGEISPRQAWHAVRAAAGTDAEPWLRQLAWRDFGHHLLHHFPHTTTLPLRDEFNRFPWLQDDGALRDWQQGRTGFPLVDAGMRQLWTCGWMHNRVRMVVASFLVKDLMIGWQQGARWFWDTLVDADLANNTLGWQWTAGCGADAAPYFRVFNPVSQSMRFDPHAQYIRRWVPELQSASATDAHRPWEMPLINPAYPPPMVDHAQARERALSAYQTMRQEMA